jgi:hypothetical protein
MAIGFPVKADYVTGDVLSAANINDLSGTLNYLDPTAKGDLFPASSGTALTRLAVGVNGTVLTADSAETTGMKWASPSAATSGLTFIAKTSFTSAASQSFNNVFSATYDNYLVKILLDSSTTAGGQISLRLRASGSDLTTATYVRQQITASSTTVSAVRGTGETSFVDAGYIDSAANSYAFFDMTFFAPYLAKTTRVTNLAGNDFTGSTQSSWKSVTYGNSNASSYDGFTIIAGAGSLNGTVYIYGMANA